jgi:hypothetical protein
MNVPGSKPVLAKTYAFGICVDVAMALLTTVTCVNNIVGRIAHVLIQPDICAAADCFRGHSLTFLQMCFKSLVIRLLKHRKCRENAELSCRDCPHQRTQDLLIHSRSAC